MRDLDMWTHRNHLLVFDELMRLQGRKSSLRFTVAQYLWALVNPWSRECFAWMVSAGIIPCINLPFAELDGVDLSGAILSGANLRFAELSNAILCDAVLADTNLTCADTDGTDFSGAFRFHTDRAVAGWRLMHNNLLVRDR